MRCLPRFLAVAACILFANPFAVRAQDNPSTTCLEWNSFLQPMYNIEENANYGTTGAALASTLYDIDGNPVDAAPLSIVSGGQTDLIVSGMAGFTPNSYGLVCSPASSSGSLNSRMMFYKIDPAGQQFQFAFAAENNARAGEQYVFFNTYQPSLAPQDANNLVANWVQISNPVEGAESGSLTGKLYFYNINGEQFDVRDISVRRGGRTDIAAHSVGSSQVGIVQWVPDDAEAIFQVREARYFYDNPGQLNSFTSAFQLAGEIGHSGELVVPFDTTGSSAILEIGNAHGAYRTSVTVRLYNESGQPIATFSDTLAPRASRHFILDGYLHGGRGVAVVSGDSILAVAMEYVRKADGGIYTLYGIPGSRPAGSVLRGSYNQYLNQESDLVIINRGADTNASVSLVRSDGNVRANNLPIVVPTNGSAVVPVGNYESADNYGVATLTGAEKIAWLLRRRSTDYVIPLLLKDPSISQEDLDAADLGASTKRTGAVDTNATNNDTTPPASVKIRWASNNASISGTVTVSVSATDNVGIDHVDFNVDGATVAKLTKPFKYQWDTTKVSNGSHAVEAIAYDYAGNHKGYSVTVNVNNADTTPPSVSLGLSKSGSPVTSPFEVTVTASDNEGSISSIKLYKDGALYGTQLGVSSATFSVIASAGTHALYALAANTAGLSTQSSSLTVTVASSDDTTPPSISISSPAAGAAVSGTVQIQTVVSDNVGIRLVEFFVDGSAIGTDDVSPYTSSWNTSTAASGTHRLTARATDTAGLPTTSAEVSVFIPSRDTQDPVLVAYVQKFDSVWSANQNSFMADSKTGYSDDYYGLEFVMEGLLSMYEATGNSTYISNTLTLIENEIARAKPIYESQWNDGGIGWPRRNGTSSLVDESRIALPYAHVGRIIKNNSALNSQFGARADAILTFLDNNLLGKWLLHRSFGNYSTVWDWAAHSQDDAPTSTSGYIQGHQILLAVTLRHAYATGSPSLIAAKKNGQTWNDLGTQIMQAYKSRLVLQGNGAYLWDQGKFLNPDSKTKIIDTFHSGEYPLTLLQYYADGKVFSATDVSRIAKTFTANIWNGMTTWPNPRQGPSGSIWFRNYTDGQDGNFADQKYGIGWLPTSYPLYGTYGGMSGIVYTGWCNLSQYDQQSYTACNALYQFIYSGSDTMANPIINRNSSSVGQIELIGALTEGYAHRTW